MKPTGFPIHQTLSIEVLLLLFTIPLSFIEPAHVSNKNNFVSSQKSNNSVLASDRSTNSPSVRASAPAFASLFFFWTPELETIICSLEPDQQRVAASLLGAGDGPVTDL